MCKGKCGCVCAMTGRILLIIGGLNWGLMGVAMLLGNGSNWNVVNLLLGSWPVAEGIVYILVGLAALMEIFGCRCSKCKAACMACCGGEEAENKM